MTNRFQRPQAIDFSKSPLYHCIHSEKTPLEDILHGALRIAHAGDAQGILLRLLGGMAIRLYSPSASHRTLARSYPDIDFATPTRRSQLIEALFVELGYEPNKSFIHCALLWRILQSR